MAGALTGCRILDFGIITAGAATSAMLADLGAEVIKIESPSYRDPFRAWPTGAGPGQAGGALPAFFRSNNRGKLGISLDLKHPEGRQAFLRLAARSDVVLENFSRGVMERLGLGPEQLAAANPDLIQLSVSSQGCTGPDAGQTSFGSTLEAVGGLAWATGYPGGAPVVTGREINYPDQTVAIFAVGMVLAAWIGRNRGQGGARLDVSQRELTSFLVGEMFLPGADQGLPPRRGNAGVPYVLQGCYRAQDNAWLAVSVERRDLPALQACLGTGVATETRILETLLGAWAAEGPAVERADRLRSSGIAAAPVLSGRQVLQEAEAGENSAFVVAADGSVLKGLPFSQPGAELAVGRDAPQIGQDTREVLERIAGYSAAEISDLAERGVIELGPG